MNRIEEAFEANRLAQQKGFIPYFTAGFPTLDESFDLILASANAGAMAVEIGVPFSDPIADGPVIQHSSQVALENKVNLDRILERVAALRNQTDCPLILMGYANNFMQYGYARFATDAHAAGVDGVIVPDLPPEEGGQLRRACDSVGLDVIYLIAQTSTEKRIRRICEVSAGFLYYVARLGVTGATQELSPKLAGKIKQIRRHTDLPVAAGFGVSTPGQVAQVVASADAAIMGSALIRMVSEHNGPDSAAMMIERFIAKCVKACEP